MVPVGSVAPDFTLPLGGGAGPVDLYALGKARHHPVVLNFFASWCVPASRRPRCWRRRPPAEQAKGSVLQFVGVDVAEQTGRAVAVHHQSGITYPVGQDADTRVAAGLYGLSGEPQTFFIDESGVVVGHHLGAAGPSAARQLGPSPRGRPLSRPDAPVRTGRLSRPVTPSGR